VSGIKMVTADEQATITGFLDFVRRIQLGKSDDQAISRLCASHSARETWRSGNLSTFCITFCSGNL